MDDGFGYVVAFSIGIVIAFLGMTFANYLNEQDSTQATSILNDVCIMACENLGKTPYIYNNTCYCVDLNKTRLFAWKINN